MLESEKRALSGQLDQSEETEQLYTGRSVMNFITGRAERTKLIIADGRKHDQLGVTRYGSMDGSLYLPLKGTANQTTDDGTEIQIGKIPFHIIEGRLFTIGGRTTAVALGTTEFPKEGAARPSEEGEEDILLMGGVHHNRTLKQQGFDRRDPEQFASLFGDFPGEIQHSEMHYTSFAAGLTSDKNHVVMSVDDGEGVETQTVSKDNLFKNKDARKDALTALTYPITRGDY
jgi:hypothetical protein